VYLLDGDDLSHVADTSRVRAQKIGFLFQDHRLMPQYTAWENVLLPLLAKADSTTADEEDYALGLMRLLGVEHLRNQYPATLSGGEASRVALCRALVHKPQLLLADEPTGQLDDKHSEQVAELLHTINRELGTTIIIVTHSETLARTADRQLILHNGRLNEV
jgi:ABC-type lipoprotein export system ATPase subunit